MERVGNQVKFKESSWRDSYQMVTVTFMKHVHRVTRTYETSAYEISKSTGFHMDFGFQNGFLNLKVDLWISKRNSGFHYYSEDIAKIYS